MQKIDFNPYMTIWTQPRKTIKKILEINPNMGFLYLSAIWFLQIFFLVVSYTEVQFPIHYAITTIIALVISPFIGALVFYFFGWLLYITGKWLKGKATINQTRCCFAWSRMPLVIDLVMWFVLSFFAAEFIFAKSKFLTSFSFVNLIALSTFVWAFVILVFTVKEVQNFSTIKALINVILSYLFVFAIIVLVVSFYYYLLR
ncbi:MAG: YIP1 family protein [Parachlamydiales bacterium]|nr:YIP1 family protein [Parachlamydiales bacterium]